MIPFDGTRYRRPHYQAGDRVRLLVGGPSWKVGDEAEVTGMNTLQTFGGHLAEYIYTVWLPNGVYLRLYEQQIAPVART